MEHFASHPPTLPRINQPSKGPNKTITNAEATNLETTAAVAAPGAPVAPTKVASKKGASAKRGAPTARKGAKAAKRPAKPKKPAKAPKPAAKKETQAPRTGSKGAKILELIGRPKGATLAAIVKATGWPAHRSAGFSRRPERSAG